LTWWYEKHNHKVVLDPARLLRRNVVEGPEFADELDDRIKYTYRYKTSNCLSYSYAWLDVDMNAWGLDYFFPPSHLIPFKRKETKDILLTLEEPRKMSPLIRQLFKEAVRERIYHNEDLPVLDDIDRLMMFGSTKTFDSSNNTKKTRTEDRCSNPSLELTNEFLYKYTFVQKTAVEDRAAVIADHKTLNTLALMRKSLEAIRNCKSDVMSVKDFSFLDDWLGSFTHDYLMSDLKKCGLTFPQDMVIAALEVMAESYPNSVFERGIECIKNQKVMIDDRWHRQTSGTNLGMLNEYVSFCMGVLVELFIERNGYVGTAEAMMYNDDQVIRFKKEMLGTSLRIQIGSDWNEFMEDAGCTVHEKKPFWSDRGVFLETYGNPARSFKLFKEVAYVGNLFWSLLAVSIPEAKSYVAGVVDNLSEHYRSKVKDVVSTIISYWGDEFTPAERSFSYPIGWIREVNDDGEYTLIDEIFNVDVQDEQRFRLIQVLTVKKPTLYSEKSKLVYKTFRDKFPWMVENLEGESTPKFVKNFKSILKPPDFRIRKANILKSEIQFQKEREKAFKGKYLKDPYDVFLSLEWDPIRYHIPPEIYTRGVGSPESDRKVDHWDLPDDMEMSLRDFIKASQRYGKFDGMFIDTKKADIELDRALGQWLSFPPGDDGLCIDLLSSIPKKDIRSWIQKSTLCDMKISRRLTEKIERWSPHFIPGKGTLVRFSEVFQSTNRVEQESFLRGISTCEEFAFELAFMVDSGEIRWEDIDVNLPEIYYILKAIKDEVAPPPEDSNSERDSEPPCPDGQEEALREYYARTDEERQNILNNIRIQIEGVSRNLNYQLGPEERAAYIQEIGTNRNLLDETQDAFAEMDSDDDLFGGAFGD
jgi:hypothetical protein